MTRALAVPPGPVVELGVVVADGGDGPRRRAVVERFYREPLLGLVGGLLGLVHRLLLGVGELLFLLGVLLLLGRLLGRCPALHLRQVISANIQGYYLVVLEQLSSCVVLVC